MEVRPGYKQSDLGIIPEDWDITTLADLGATFGGLSGKTKRDFGHGADRYITFMNIMSNVVIDCETFELVDVKPTETQNQATKGDLFFNGSSETPGEVGMCAVLADDVQGVFLNSFCFGFRFREGAPADGLYLAYYFRSREGRELMGPLAQGAIRYNLSKTALLKTRFPLPQRVEQEAIADALSDADALIESLEQLLAKKRQLKKGTMQELLTGKKRLPGFSGEWIEASLGRMGHCLRGVSYNPALDLSPFDTEATIRLLRANNVQEAKVVFEDVQYVDSSRVSTDQRLRADDILICMASGSRELVGKAGKFSADDGFAYTFGAFMGCFRPDNDAADPDFVFCVFQTAKYRAHIAVVLAGSSINNLTPGSVEALLIRVPSDKAEQRAIAAILSDMDADMAALEAKVAKARQLKQGMMQELLTGRIRLV